MHSLNCKLGDLAITIRADNPENIGKIVRIVSSRGLTHYTQGKPPMHVWNVESAVAGVALLYKIGEHFYYKNRGIAPDQYLVPLLRPAVDDAQETHLESQSPKKVASCGVFNEV